jgi:nucleotide-binding universal stress UspA family protein
VWSIILVPTDFSATSDAALVLAARLAKEQGARLEILHVVELTGGLHARTRIQPEDAAAPISVEQFVRDGTLPRMEAQVQRAGLKPGDHRCAIAFGRPADTIVREAEERGADLIVLATHGRRGIERWFVGSCAEAVVRRATMPVLTVRVPGDEPGLTPEEQALRDESTG